MSVAGRLPSSTLYKPASVVSSPYPRASRGDASPSMLHKSASSIYKLATKEAEQYIDAFFARKIGLYILKIAIILEVGNNGVCWFQEIEPEVIVRYLTNDPPYEVVQPTKILAYKSRKQRGILYSHEGAIRITSDEVWHPIPLAPISTISSVLPRK